MRALLIEPEKRLADYLSHGLTESSFVVDVVDNGTDGLHLGVKRLRFLFASRFLGAAQQRANGKGLAKHLLRVLACHHALQLLHHFGIGVGALGEGGAGKQQCSHEQGFAQLMPPSHWPRGC